MQEIYYQKPYQRVLNARLVSLEQTPAGCWLATSDSIFYPGGGGQASDRGRLAGHAVSKIKKKNGTIWHFIEDKAQLQVGENVKLELDWAWRYYNMQQHTGQHLLSHILHKEGFPTVSVHLGEEYTLIEVEGGIPDESRLDHIEREVNERVRRRLAVKSYEVNRAQAERLPLRRPPGDWQTLRIVEIDEVDFSACGGTHVFNTAEIGYIKIAGLEKIRGHARIKAYIGDRADRYFRQLHKIAEAIKTRLNTKPQRFEQRIQDLLERNKALKKETAYYEERYLQYRAEQLYQSRGDTEHRLLVVKVADCNPSQAQTMARYLSEQRNVLSFFMVDGKFVLSVPESSKFDGQDFLKQNQTALGIKGGGSPSLLQGRMDNEHISEVRKALLNTLET